MLLALYIGQRRSDVVRMGWKDIEDGFIEVRQEKTKAFLGIPIAPALAEALRGSPKNGETSLSPLTASRSQVRALATGSPHSLR